jgi:hypothetical protein
MGAPHLACFARCGLSIRPAGNSIRSAFRLGNDLHHLVTQVATYVNDGKSLPGKSQTLEAPPHRPVLEDWLLENGVRDPFSLFKLN